ncbi:hypothetical protein SALWKB12_0803 [Snodgrassella communis]|uniref:Uncharacterized protein n=1 Tax=Snodgrassella communis TaxID=2946699 RepID=A0A836Z2T4_9NEIS|nr:hypothetical protein SALWKB12_0803 [Snodgrassella communis]KDN14092.1 hypothetical protein SALWKB29_1882 [Snodgrassella communis]
MRSNLYYHRLKPELTKIIYQQVNTINIYKGFEQVLELVLNT